MKKHCNLLHSSNNTFMVNVQKFQTGVGCQKSLDKQCRPRSDCFFRSSLIRVFPVCHSHKYFVNFSPDNQPFHYEQKRRSVQNFRTFNIGFACIFMLQYYLILQDNYGLFNILYRHSKFEHCK